MKKKKEGIHLLKKSKRGLVRILFSRSGVILGLLLLQIYFMFSALTLFQDRISYFWLFSALFSLLMFVFLLNSKISPTAKLTWAFVLLMAPVFGGPLFFFVQSDLGHRSLKKQYEKQIRNTQNLPLQDKELLENIKSKNKSLFDLNCFLNKSGCQPIFDHTDVVYYPSGEKAWEAMLKEIQKAKKYIYLEFFIIEEGEMWGKILELLAEKAREGVEVRVLYDGSCEFMTLPRSYPQKLKKLGIFCKVFAPITPFVSTHYNYRDHRKIVVIDGNVAFTGGINLADEYINHRKRFGHWKDSAVMLTGKGAISYTLFFLQMWNIGTSKNDETSLLQTNESTISAQGYVMPFVDCPLDDYKVGKAVYLDILNRAEHYVHIMTPYLILDGETEAAIIFAAERGVDVTLILPGIPDKKIPYALARTHYHALLNAGVKIYEYTPGFVHSKVFVSDDKVSVVGTINLDYRSLYHHFETAAYLYQNSCIPEIESDFQSTLAQSKEVTPDNYKRKKGLSLLLGAFLKIIAPLF